MRLLRIVPDNTKFRIVHWRRLAYPFSAAYSVLVLALFLTVGLNFGIDFRGGTLMEMQAKSGKPDIAQVRQTANSFGFGEVEVQEFGNAGDLSMRFALQPGGEVAQQAVVTKARAAFAEAYEFRRVETVGPRVSGELVQAGTLGVVLAIMGVLVYLWFRFEMQLAIGAIVGTMHDIVLTLGFFLITQLEFNLTSIAAILTIVGYSLNETVVVFDRTRELLRRYKTMPIPELLDLSVNSTLSRTAITSTTTILALIALVFFGGTAIEGFALVMLFGVMVCTYSAMFVSTPVLLYLDVRAGRLDQSEELAEAKARV
ncbi:Protein-export membrane protein SecF [Bosea sp. 62]|uniref:protein translocase subunit SecF n=1 Tax=unclassified Bosea (in: a-proteobacteria) TaxID=2653178 RepID=UPI0012566DC1|nr:MULTISPECIES: protein translocase subunit SecF [unclassified Bosea (in: a-proteobacteria)]CAD5255494.1 Protein-export membrane protein SecF [Bosea sp. 21B]CAD5284751.1 Protein-export membrane protein SecF [Bosea sp. 7B]CAD5301659.1 Protein-export membrane protein SecF [Bosea sp. 46]VVT57778.1 Protein-export membrane protein SecF [Bosea sp. EC-HK365B]VXB31138.1 Protein-export membrane protein SecF [Bosea sp. 29B]